MRGNAELLLRRGEYREPLVTAILEQGDRMGRSLDDLTDVVRLEAGGLSLRLRRVDLVELVHREAKVIQGQNALHRFLVQAPRDPVVGEWDGDRVSQVLQNLLGNAVKYAPEGGDVVIAVGVTEGAARLEVRDEEPGIPAEHPPRLFERFYRADSTGAEGLGLGL